MQDTAVSFAESDCILRGALLEVGPEIKTPYQPGPSGDAIHTNKREENHIVSSPQRN